MIFHGALLAFEKEDDLPLVKALGERTWELVDFIVNGLGITEWPGKFDASVSFHSSCHLRGSNSKAAVQQLTGTIDKLTVKQFDEEEQCCGFGGTFAVSFPNVSREMGDLKVENLTKPNPDIVASADMGCMMHFGGMMEKKGMTIKRMHIAQILRDSLKNGGLI